MLFIFISYIAIKSLNSMLIIFSLTIVVACGSHCKECNATSCKVCDENYHSVTGSNNCKRKYLSSMLANSHIVFISNIIRIYG